MRLELSITTTYLPNWHQYEGIRELLQNGKDAETELSAKLDVRFRKESGTLVIENEGAVLPHEALLLGHTTKAGRADMRGKFGEGLKLGVLALVRDGRKVRIRSGSEVWVPSIQRSERFKADVLVFDIEGGRKDTNRVSVEVSGLTEDDWNVIRECFLFLVPEKQLKDHRIEVSGGALLLGDKFKGKLFVKGIFVGNDPRLNYGYDFNQAEVDRDRKMIASWDLQYKTQDIWQEAVAKRPDMIDKFLQLLDGDAPDVEGMSEYTARNLPKPVKEKAVQEFRARFGTNAVPVEKLSESKEIEHLGKKGIVAPKPLRSVIESETGTLYSIKQGLRNEVVKNFSWSDLDEAERANLERAVALVGPHAGVTLDDVSITEFRDPKIGGLYKYENGKHTFMLAKRALASATLCLGNLIHEVAHKSGADDGDKTHVECIELLWMKVAESLLAVPEPVPNGTLN